MWFHPAETVGALLAAASCIVTADQFQSYCQQALAFSIKRGGILYGTGEHCLRAAPGVSPHNL
jgi:hypothetical protein